MRMSFESHVAFHCAPTLAGVKPSNIFTWRHTKELDVNLHIARLREKLSGSGIVVDKLCECEQHSLILIYREEMLEESFNKPEVRDFLNNFDYPKEMNLRGCIEKLKSRMERRDGFPHEIGLFLGYPLHDVAGFIHCPEKRCALCGEWKVYRNERDALRLFELFRKSRAELYARFLSGSDIAELVA